MKKLPSYRALLSELLLDQASGAEPSDVGEQLARFVRRGETARWTASDEQRWGHLFAPPVAVNPEPAAIAPPIAVTPASPVHFAPPVTVQPTADPPLPSLSLWIESEIQRVIRDCCATPPHPGSRAMLSDNRLLVNELLERRAIGPFATLSKADFLLEIARWLVDFATRTVVDGGNLLLTPALTATTFDDLQPGTIAFAAQGGEGLKTYVESWKNLPEIEEGPQKHYLLNQITRRTYEEAAILLNTQSRFVRNGLHDAFARVKRVA